MFRYPEALGLVIAAQILIGRYTGYRLTELYRFREFLRGRRCFRLATLRRSVRPKRFCEASLKDRRDIRCTGSSPAAASSDSASWA